MQSTNENKLKKREELFPNVSMFNQQETEKKMIIPNRYHREETAGCKWP